MPRNGDKMKLKYYMRGIGVGILFSIMVFLFVDKEEPQMTDEQIIAAAKELGMEEKKSIDLSGLNPTPITSLNHESDNVDDTNNSPNVEQEDGKEQDNIPSVTPDSDVRKTDDSNAIDDGTKEDSTTENSEDSKKEEDTSESSDGTKEDNHATVGDNNSSEDNSNSLDGSATDEIISFVISKGMYSHDVADLCESIGLVKNAKEFDRYLVQNGYASKIRFNRYEIQAGASFEEIAHLITTKPQF